MGHTRDTVLLWSEHGWQPLRLGASLAALIWNTSMSHSK